VPTVKTWILIGALVAFVMIPICWKFWKGWDRPSRAAKKEMLRRIQERDMRDQFLLEDAKIREQERLEAQRELTHRKAQDVSTVEPSILKQAFVSLDENLEENSASGKEMKGNSSANDDRDVIEGLK